MSELPMGPQLDYALPCEALRPYVSVYYQFDCPMPHFSDGERAAIAQLRLIISGSATMEFADGRRVECFGACLLGPTTTAVRFTVEGPFRMLGMGLLPAGWGALTSASAADYTDQLVPAQMICPDIIDQMKDIGALPDLPAVARAADRILAPMASMAAPELLSITQLVDDWLASSVSPSIADLHARSSLSERQLTRRVNQLYGMPPKYLSRKYRALRAARALIDGNPEETEFLRDAFYDQSHMIREVKRFTGTTPARLRTREGELAKLIDQRRAFAGQTSPLVTET